MRRQLYVILLLLCFAGVSASSFGQDDAKADLEAQVQALTQEVSELRSAVEESQTRLDATVKYLEQNRKAAQELTSALAASEAAGFTFGINPKSREILLAGWRKQLAAAQKGVPGAPAQAGEAAESTDGIRQPKRW